MSCPPQQCQWVVSVEGVPVPARVAVLKALQARLGLVPVPDHDRTTDPLGLLLHRVRGVARYHPRHHALLCGAWLAGCGGAEEHPLLHQLHAQLTHQLAAKLLDAAPVRHLLLCLDASPHEAFEHVLDAKDATLQGLLDTQARTWAAQAGRVLSPFGDPQIVRVACPAFAADNPATLDRLVDQACELCARVVHT